MRTQTTWNKGRETILDRDSIMRVAPSVFATEPWHGMSERYKFIPTYHVLDILGDMGFRPIRALQSSSRIEGKSDYTRHMLRLRHDNHLGALAVGDEFPELILTNSHDGASTYVIEFGIHRKICMNGLCVSNPGAASRHSIRHQGSEHDFDRRVVDVTEMIADSAPQAIRQVSEWKGIELSQRQRVALARNAITFRDATVINPANFLGARRTADSGADVWTTLNVIQENVMRGGVRGYNADHRRVRTRPVNSVDAELRFNRHLWETTQTLVSML